MTGKDDDALIERSTAGLMQWLHRPENATDLAALRAQVDHTVYWKQWVSGNDQAEQDSHRDKVISAAVKHLFTESGVNVLNDGEHCRFYISMALKEIDKADEFHAYQKLGQKWIGRTVKDPSSGERGH